ncbi:self-incompatibility protein S1-like [Tasmannia lanceolata]|uniref:self-incompatibility protein S1-like n=1 Tax=Tasmannia lanceolata TaxID=3420 RepID=UPI0040630A78
MRVLSYILLVLVVFSFYRSFVLSDKVHVSITNHLGDGKNMTIHCQSKDNDLGEQTVADGAEFGWDFSINVVGTTLFYCDMGLESVNEFHFDAYSFQRDSVRCESACLWLISEEGVYGGNNQTGFWEFMYFWPN